MRVLKTDGPLVLADSADEPGYAPDLEAAGCRLKFREPSWHEHRFFVDEPAVQIHVFSVGSAEVERMLLFRDRLRLRLRSHGGGQATLSPC